jgi:hypothetical protein
MRTVMLTLKDAFGRDVLGAPIASVDARGRIVTYSHILAIPHTVKGISIEVVGNDDSLASDDDKVYDGEGGGSGGSTP